MSIHAHTFVRSGGKWRTQHARQLFCEAFIRSYGRPAWLARIDFHPEPHDADHPIATFHSRNDAVPLKVLPHHVALTNFRARYPDSKNLPIIVHRSDTPEQIRDRVFKEAGRLLA